ncbi:hypothetical protein N5F13_00475 [Comamonas thiooxydans]|uniref:hypothetical protein n=1 Tax=Comamonas thiooxydans TaxID=363952 RepID=UPI0024489E6C|nr:hypothetical protein [Comamonas thiooxydans]MDH1472956.1 hypothetical protein [Comamonas thiooxydans]
MSEIDQECEQEEERHQEAKLRAAKNALEARCKVAGIGYEERPDAVNRHVCISLKSGRNVRKLTLFSELSINKVLSVPFESYVFLSGLEAMCSYSDGTIEASVRPVGSALTIPFEFMCGLLFGEAQRANLNLESAKIELAPSKEGQPAVEISQASEAFYALSKFPVRNRLTLKLKGCHVKTHDAALALLQKLAGSVLFQVDLLLKVPLALERERRMPTPPGKRARRAVGPEDLRYPQTQFDQAPLSLYSYARSAVGMPLLQFLAFYQVIEFYFPIYSQSEAQRRIKAILKDPTFRGDRDADIARLLASIQVSRSGAYGDERSQLRATLLECTDSGELRQFLEEDEPRKVFFQTKSKSLPCHMLPIATPTADLCSDVSERIYDIRCKIVHTKSDSRDSTVELLLPFSPEAEQLSYDIELVQYLAEKVMISSSTPLNVHD